MITQNLFDEILIKPAKEGCDKLYIVSGYATSAMAFHHLENLKKLNRDVKIELIVGMCPQDGLSLSNHKGFQQLIQTDFPDNFQCSYIMQPPATHSKVYSWFSEDTPRYGFIGSANYTQLAFSDRQREVVDSCDPENAYDYFGSLINDTIYCTHPDAENFVQIYNDNFYLTKKRALELIPELKDTKTSPTDFELGLPNITVSLLDNTGKLPQRSGLNWGQRPEHKREPNQAYIRLTSEIYKSDFFPPIKIHFTVLTDDSKILICSRAQQNGKAIHTPHNNSLIGEYFRSRLDIPSGRSIKKSDLIKYGRTDLTFYKIDNETYFMDF